MRAFAAAVYALAIGLVGAGLGPTALGLLSDMFAGQAFHAGDFLTACPGGRGGAGLDAVCRAASTEGLRHALISVQVLYVWAAIHFLLAARTLRRDLHDPQPTPA